MIEAPEGAYDTVFIETRRHRDDTRALVALGWQHTEPGALIVLNGNKTDGIEAMKTALARITTIDGTYSKSHGRVVWFRRPDGTPQTIQDWAEAGRISINADGYFTAPSTFSAAHVDPASALLASRFTAKVSGRVADLGAGWGYLTHRLLATAPDVSAALLIEADRTSLAAAQLNVTDPRAEFLWADATALPTQEPVDWVVMNPPFHNARSGDPDIGRAFISAAADMLTRKGHLLMVANRHLPYEATLNAYFRQVRSDNSHPSFKIIEATHPH